MAGLTVLVMFFYLGFYKALQLGPIALVGPIVAAHSAVVVVLAVVFLGEKISQWQLVAIGAIVAGVAMASIDVNAIRSGRNLIGLGVALAIVVSIAAGFWQFAIAAFSREIGWFAPVFFTRLFMVGLLTPVVAIRRERLWRGLNRKLTIAVVGSRRAGNHLPVGVYARLRDRNCLDSRRRIDRLPGHPDYRRNRPVQGAAGRDPVRRAVRRDIRAVGSDPATIEAHSTTQEDKMALKDSVCIITGGGSGIGRATGLMMAEEGAVVVAVGRTASKVEAVRDEIVNAGGAAEAYGVDVGEKAAVAAMVDEVLDKYGKVDVLVNNAGHSSPRRMLLTTTPEDLSSVYESNLSGSVFCTQAVVPSMVDAGQGTIINVSSMAGVNASPLAGMSYSAAKAAVINFTAFINAEYRNTGIRASVVIPGEVDTPILDGRPVVPDSDARSTMVTAEDTAEAITLIARLPQRAAIPELIIRPTWLRDTSAEINIA